MNRHRFPLADAYLSALARETENAAQDDSGEHRQRVRLGWIHVAELDRWRQAWPDGWPQNNRPHWHANPDGPGIPSIFS